MARVAANGDQPRRCEPRSDVSALGAGAVPPVQRRLPNVGAGEHPSALGRPLREVWPEIRSVLQPAIADVMERGESVLLENRPVRLERQGQRADTYVTFDVSPVRMGDGSIAGALASLVATTATKAVGVLRERTLIEIADTGEQTRRDRAETFPKSFLLSSIGTVVSELPDGAIVEVNEGFTAATGYRADEAMGRTSAILTSGSMTWSERRC